MRINVHAGHNPAGKVACGAVGLIQESVEDRRVKDEVISQLRQLGHVKRFALAPIHPHAERSGENLA